MVSPSAAVQERRQQQFDDATTRAEIDQLERQWQAEDDAAARVESDLAREVGALRDRVAQLERHGKALVQAVGEMVGKQVQSLRDEFEVKLKSTPPLQYRGVWTKNVHYDLNNSVTHSGSLWIAKAATTAEPGTSDHWQMAVRAGRDLRPPRDSRGSVG